MKSKKFKPTDAQHTIAFVLQGGGALGAYQAGACEALAIHARQPDWVGEFTTVDDVAAIALLFAAFPSNALTGQSMVVSHGWFMQ